MNERRCAFTAAVGVPIVERLCWQGSAWVGFLVARRKRRKANPAAWLQWAEELSHGSEAG
ncbi:hypothetical protein [Jannaschia sp. R86511]|uniref:hypothetical protein n=1 Tax=Jannaschia sp. R86511 TaxID=3093853 RepID=UPI0036D4103F